MGSQSSKASNEEIKLKLKQDVDNLTALLQQTSVRRFNKGSEIQCEIDRVIHTLQLMLRPLERIISKEEAQSWPEPMTRNEMQNRILYMIGQLEKAHVDINSLKK